MTAQELIRQFWPDHVDCAEFGPGEIDGDMGVICACGAVLGFPGQDPDMVTDLESQSTPPWEGSGTERIEDSAAGMDPDASTEGEANAEAIAAMSTGTQIAMREPVSAVIPEDPIKAAIMAIDPTRPYTSTDVELQLVDIAGRLERGQLYQRVWEVRLFQATTDYERRWNHVVHVSDGRSEDKRKAEAFVKCDEEGLYQAKIEADMMVRAIRETMHNLRALQSGFQTISRSVNASLSGGYNN